MQVMKYDIHGEMDLMEHVWSPEIADNPYAFVMFMYPWGVPGTPLEKFTGPRNWQKSVLLGVRDFVKNNHNIMNEAKLSAKIGEIVDAAFETHREAIGSGRGIGKSALVSWLSHWMLSTRIGSSVIISANNETQLRSVTWGELTRWLAMAENSHWFEVAATKITPAAWLSSVVEKDFRKGTRYWSIEGRLWSEENPDAYAGLHNMDGVMLIFDEASGIPDPIWSVAAGFFTENTPNRFWFAFSNPRRNKGYFFECFNSRSAFWKTRTIDARSVEGTDKQVYEAIIEEYGPDSPQAYVEVYGMFPESGDDQFISPFVVSQAGLRPLYLDLDAPITIGIDPARTGRDSTVIAVRQGRDLIELKRFSNQDTMTTVGHIINYIREYKPELVAIDEGGLGFGILDRLLEQNYKVKGVNFSSNALKKKMYANKRAEMWGDMRDWLKTASLHLYKSDVRLKKDLTAPSFTFDSSGAILLESKASMKKRGLPSPDSGDAIALTFSHKVMSRRKTAHDTKVFRGENSNFFSRSGGDWMSG